MSRVSAIHEKMHVARTDVVGVELVHAHEHADGCTAEHPGHAGAQAGELALVQVIHQQRIKLRSDASERPP